MSKLLTISIAAYNVEQYLKETLESFIVPETMDDVEVLIIDDGSKDRTESIAREYQERYPDTFKYVKKENGGHGSTINKGIALATGKYFRVVDGDDYVSKQAFLDYIDRLRTCDEDMIVSDFRVVDSRGKIKVDPSIMEHGTNPFDQLRDGKHYDFSEPINTRVFGLSSVTIKTSLLQKNNVKITEKCYYVDVEFIIWCIFLAEGYTFFSCPVYMYRKDENGNNSVNKQNMIKNVAMQEKVALRLCEIYEELQKCCKNKIKLSAIINRIGISLGATYRTYMLMPLRDCEKNIKRIDHVVRKKYPNASEQLENVIFIKCVRSCGYFFIPFTRGIYRIYIER